MQLSYDGIVFDIVFLESWRKQAVYTPDNTQFQCYHHILDATVTVGGDSNNRRRWPTAQYEDGSAYPAVKRSIKEPPTWGELPPPGPADLPKQPRLPGLLGGQLVAEADEEFFPNISPQDLRHYVEKGANRPGGVAGDMRARLNARPNTPPELQTMYEAAADKPNFTLPWTDNEIRQRLRVPRRQLVVWMYSNKANDLDDTINGGAPEYLLVSPLSGVGTDARHGPICTVIDTPRLWGNVSGVFRLRFETWEAPLDPMSNSQATSAFASDTLGFVPVKEGLDPVRARQRLTRTPAMLSNRWTMSMAPDPETYLYTTTIEGEAVFRMDVLKIKALTADQMRRQFMHPIPWGYTRLPPKVQLNSAGDGIQYEIIDVEVMTNFPAGRKYGMVSIDVQQMIKYHSPINLMRWGSDEKGPRNEIVN